MAVSSLPVKREFGPSLPDLVSPRLLAAGGAVLAVILAVLVFTGGVGSNETHVVVRDPVAFNLRYNADALKRVDTMPGEILRIEGPGQSLTIKNLYLPAYRGWPTGELPVFIQTALPELRHRWRDFEIADEGRVRLNEVPGYSIGFRARGDDGERVWGRYIMVVPDEAGARQGVTIEIIARRGAGVSNAAEVGATGQTKLPYRSFRFGTEAP